MAVVSTVKLSELEGAKRIDPEFYRSDILDMKAVISKSKFNVFKLSKIIKKGYRVVYWSTNILSPDERCGNDVYFLQATNIEGSFPFINVNNMGYVWRRDWEQYPEGRINRGELLIEVKGKAEKVALVPNDFPLNTLVSGTLYKFTVKKSIEPEYILIFFLTKFGKGFRDRLKTNTLISFVNKRDLYNIPVVLPPPEFRQQIQKLYNEAYGEFKKSHDLYCQAENLLLGALGLENFEPKCELVYTNMASNASRFHRMDAEYFQPLCSNLIKHLSAKVRLEPLSKFLLGFKKGVEVGTENYQEGGKPFLRVSNLSTSGFVERDMKYIDEELYNQLKDEYEIKNGDFLLTKDATPGIAYVVKESTDGIISSGILRLNINEKEIDKEYLALCINSIIGRLQVERDIGGSVIMHWKPEQIKKLQIPILPSTTQQEIASLIRQSHKARKKAKDLLEEAKKEVEKAIEGEVN